MWSTFLQAFGLQHGIFRYFGLSRTQFPCTLHFRCFFWPSIARLWYRCSRSTIVCHTSSWLVHLVYFPVYCISSIIAVYPLPALLCHFLPSMTAISFDRYLALTLHLLYVAIITVNRVINFILLAFDLFLVFESGIVRESVSSLHCFSLHYCWHGSDSLLLHRGFTMLRRHQKQTRDLNSMAMVTQRYFKGQISLS